MAVSRDTKDRSTGAERLPELRSDRSLMLVAGSGRSGTSLFGGILQRLGFHVPEPEVPADSTNPRGFAEAKWVVDFHSRLLSRAGVQTADARPAAWALTADAALDDGVHEELRDWLGEQFETSDHLLIKDPRLSWFLPLWRRCAEEAGIEPRFATVLRHPAAVVESKQRYYGGWQTDVNRTAGWLNQTLFTERATRDGPRVFVRYEDLLEDWTKIVGRVGEALQLTVIRDAPAASIVSIHEFVDRGLSRSLGSWDDIAVPQPLRQQVDVVWELISRLADEDAPDRESTIRELDEARAAYVALYEEAEAIAQSSVVASGRTKRRKERGGRLVRLAAKIPRGYREKMPLRLRKAAYRTVHRRPRRAG